MKRMLLVTPDPEAAEILKLAFELHDFKVIHALSSTVALDHFKAHDPHIVIVDIMGIRTDELKGAEDFVNQTAPDARPTFILTTKIPPLADYPALHANHLLKKPYNLTTLIKMVTGVVNRNE